MTETSNTLARIEAHYENLTHLEKEIADYFLREFPINISASSLSQSLHISPASLTRFAKKCGFRGYREFAYAYKNHLREQGQKFTSIHHGLTKRVLSDYDELLKKTYSLVDEEQIERISLRLEQAQQIYFYGQGSSGMVATEMKLRFMRLGLVCEAVTDAHMLQWVDNLLHKDCLVIAHSVSGKTPAVLQALQKAKAKGAQTVLMTTQKLETVDFIDEIILIASARNLSYGNRISPQFPLLMITDLLFAYVMASDPEKKEHLFGKTIIHPNKEVPY